jgi:hypothetical protein
MKEPRSTFLKNLVAHTEASLASDTLSASERDDLEKWLREFRAHSDEDITAYDFFFEHMPDADDDLTLIILKGHLLVEHQVRAFVDARLLTPNAIAQARFSSYQLICLAEAMCLPNKSPAWLWDMVRKLNSLRNHLAHNLAPADVEERVEQFLAAYRVDYPGASGLMGAIGNLYARVAALAGLANEPGFQIPRGKEKRST